MTTPDSSSTPKNYIVSGISKSLLTPCRRIGLSRSKKTPKNSITEIPIPEKEIATTPINTNKDFILKKDVDLDSTPKQSSSPKLNRSKTKADLSKGRTIEKNQQLVRNALSPLPVDDKSSAKRPKNIILQRKIRSATIQSSSTTKYVELGSNPEDENEVNTNNIKRAISGTTNTCLGYDDEFYTPKRHKQPEAPDISHSQSHDSTESTSEDFQPDSPTISSLVQNITVQMHKPAAKRNINFNQISEDQESLQSYSESYTQESIMNNGEHLEPLRNKKRKLNTDSFKINNEQFSDPKNISSKLKLVKQNSESNNSKPTRGNSMARFNTEDYLTEYSKSPMIFPKYLEQEYSSTTNDDDLDDFMPSKEFKFTKTKSDSEEKKDRNSNVAILRPSITTEAEVNNGITQLYKASKEILPEPQLINSLEQMSNKSINKEGIKLNTEKVHSILDQKKIASTKSNIENDCDEEMFTSSPESNKKQRENLIRLISEIEKEVKQKEETLDRLKRARVYKKIHSPEKVSKSSERWLEACKIGLRDLLMKMQEHGPMEMENLIKNLKIPDHISEKLELL